MLELLVSPPAVTTTGPVVALVGAVTVMLEVDQLVTVPGAVLKVTDPAVPVKFAPAMVTEVPPSPFAGVTLLTMGATVNPTPLLCNPPWLTTTLPVRAPLGT
jgi:hypothetical protein